MGEEFNFQLAKRHALSYEVGLVLENKNSKQQDISKIIYVQININIQHSQQCFYTTTMLAKRY